jgi:ParB family chromosome partitioning protein
MGVVLEIVYKKVSDLIPYVNNARTHSEEQVNQIVSSMKEFEFTNPILTDGDNGIIAGHGRLMAAKKLGMDSVPTVELSHLSAAQKKAYIIADNKLAINASWDDELLALEFDELREMDFDLELTGFDDSELDALIGAFADEVDLPALNDGDKPEFQQMTFTLHDSQAEQVKIAIDAAKYKGDFIDSLNENSNGNALSRICETYLTQHGNG